jgi:formate dehydrogenase iron-sulfur subunit
MSYKIFVPIDSTALSLGANEVAAEIQSIAISRGIEIDLVRNGSRGLFWLEPFVEVETADGRIAYGPIEVSDVQSMFDSEFYLGKAHEKCHGKTEEINWLKNQERLTFARTGIASPLDLDEYIKNDGFNGLKKSLNISSQEIVDIVKDSGLRGRGGAAFPTGIKWQTVLDASSDQKYIVCNADEGDSGTFSDRMAMENDPFVLIEGMIISGLAVGSDQGYIYLRSEYPHAMDTLNKAIKIAEEKNFLGKEILGTEHNFFLEVRRAAGAYICGEETSLLESLEGKRGLVRYKPPLPAIEGLFGKPTVVNNVISLATIPIILSRGAKYYADFGVGRSKGTLPIQLAGNLKHTGLIEKAFGITLRELLYDFGGGSASGKKIKAVQVGGPLGAFISEENFDVELDYEAFSKLNAVVGHGGIVAFDETINMAEMARYSFEFCAIESCGKCTPCRIGSTRGMEVIDKITENNDQQKNIKLLENLCDTMVNGSLCAMGGMTPFPVMSALKYFPKDFGVETKPSET